QILCERLSKESKGLRKVIFKSYRVDDKINTIEIGTNRATHNKTHLLKLFANKLDSIEPGEGIEVFTMEALQTEDVLAAQEKIWNQSADPAIYELLDRIAGKFGSNKIHRFLPAEHHWPERSVKAASSIEERPTISWRTDKPRPIHLLSIPELITVTAPIPDYPPMLFRYKGTLHKVKKADGPERIEQEWWIRQGEHRDYYAVEDEKGCRFWIFRLGHYTGDKTNQWFLHGFFA
ncbi:MAG TPA: DNA polymerase Y family protein, partial [Chitinophagaceae bacterium]|nr:DNA polymerase Y family protein [Chitinophagaceae bacterium]